MKKKKRRRPAQYVKLPKHRFGVLRVPPWVRVTSWDSAAITDIDELKEIPHGEPWAHPDPRKTGGEDE